MSRAERRALVRRAHPELSVSRQCRLLSVGRSSRYDTIRGESEETLALMRRIDALFLKYPFYGARQMVRHLRREGVRIGRRQVGRLMHLLGLQAIYLAPRLSAAHPAHRVYPYLLKGLTIERANQVWCADITYIPVRCGGLYLVAIMDWASRHVLAWRLSNTLDDALASHGPPEIFNTDQGSQFTSGAFTGRLQAAGIQISMDGRGRCMDNIFIERLWRSLKYEAVYLHELADGLKARRVIGEWIGFYTTERPHLALGGRTPAEAYRSARQRRTQSRASGRSGAYSVPHCHSRGVPRTSAWLLAAWPGGRPGLAPALRRLRIATPPGGAYRPARSACVPLERRPARRGDP